MSASDDILDDVAAIGLRIARRLEERIMLSNDDEAIARLGDTFHRVTRGLRQTLALKARLQRDEARGRVEDAQEGRSAAAKRAQVRRSQVTATVERLIYTEHEDDEALKEELDVILNEEELLDAFLHDDLPVVIARVCNALQIPSPPAGEGVVRSATDEGSHDSPAQPLSRALGHLLPEKVEPRPSG